MVAWTQRAVAPEAESVEGLLWVLQRMLEATRKPVIDDLKLETSRHTAKEASMTMPDERARALVWAGGFLLELIHDGRIPEDVRLKAKRIARHFPCIDDVAPAAGSPDNGYLEIAVPDKQVLKEWTNALSRGPLTWTSRTS